MENFLAQSADVFTILRFDGRIRALASTLRHDGSARSLPIANSCGVNARTILHVDLAAGIS